MIPAMMRVRSESRFQEMTFDDGLDMNDIFMKQYQMIKTRNIKENAWLDDIPKV